MCLLLILFPFPVFAGADMVIGGESMYATQKGDCPLLVAARTGVDWQVIARENGLDAAKQCRAGARLVVKNRKIVPKVVENGIIINIPDRMLFYFKQGKLATAFPVGLGSRDWQTPTGSFVIVGKEKDPIWHVPKSIQAEMVKKGQPVKEIVPPGADNPLGRYALQTSFPGILIHETIWPTTIYQWRSHGCIRVLPEHMDGFYGDVQKGTTGEIIYKPVSLAVSEENRVFLQVSRDIYKAATSLDDEAKSQIENRGLSDKVDWAKVESTMKRKSGLAEDITL
jgi:L,D-transpeptidase ErfK/SrfK